MAGAFGGDLLGGKWARFWLVGAVSSNLPPPCPILPVGKTLKVDSKIWKKLKEEMGCLKRNLYKTD